MSSSKGTTKKRRVQKSTKNKHRFTKKHTKVRHSVSTFKSLPIEIIKEIFCNLACYDLLEIERVCQLWNTTIHELLEPASYSEVFNILREVAYEYSDWAPYALWIAALSFTGLEDPCNQLKKQGHGGEFAKSNLSKYEWYMLLSGYRDNIGVVAVYPDNPTFSVFTYPDDPKSVEVCSTDSFKDSDNIDWEAAQGYNDDDYSYHMVDEFNLYDALC